MWNNREMHMKSAGVKKTCLVSKGNGKCIWRMGGVKKYVWYPKK